jgi:hypothetical protein
MVVAMFAARLIASALRTTPRMNQGTSVCESIVIPRNSPSDSLSLSSSTTWTTPKAKAGHPFGLILRAMMLIRR